MEADLTVFVGVPWAVEGRVPLEDCNGRWTPFCCAIGWGGELLRPRGCRTESGCEIKVGEGVSLLRDVLRVLVLFEGFAAPVVVVLSDLVGSTLAPRLLPERVTIGADG